MVKTLILALLACATSFAADSGTVAVNKSTGAVAPTNLKLQADSVKLNNATASQPARIGADKTLTNGVINLSGADVTGTLPLGNLPSTAATDAEVTAGLATKADTVHAHAASDITSGTVSKARGGTGADNSAVTFPASGTITVNSDWNTIGELESATGVDILISTEIDTKAEFEAKLFTLPTIVVEETDTSPSVSSVTRLKVSNGTLTDNGDGSVTLNIPPPGGGEANTGSNLGIGYPTFSAKSGEDLQFNTITNGSGILVSSNSHTFTFSVDTSIIATDAEVTSALAGYQTLDADLTDLADGSLTGSKVGTGIAAGNVTTGTLPDGVIPSAITRDTEWDSVAKIESATGSNILISTELDSLAELEALIGSSLATDAEVSAGYQPLDADLTDLADGSLTGSKVGTGISASNVTTGTLPDGVISSQITRDNEWDTITEIETATGVNILISTELDSLAELEALTGASFATDSETIHNNVGGEINAITDKATPVGADHLLIEDSAASNAKKDITIASMESALEAVIDLQDLQGAVTSGQLPSGATLDSEWDTIAKIETATSANIITGTEIDTLSELQTLIGQTLTIPSTTTFSTNNQHVFNQVYLGTGTNVVVDPRIQSWVWAPSTNCRWRIGTNSLSATNQSTTFYITIYSPSDGIQWTNITDTWTAKGNVGVLKAGYNLVKGEWDAGVLFLSQETAQIAANQIGDGTIDDTEFASITSRQTGPLSGDISTSSNSSGVTTLASTGVSAGTYGSATQVPQITVDAKGRITAASNVSVSGITGLDIDTSASSTNATTNAVWTLGLDTSRTAQVKLWAVGGGSTNYASWEITGIYRRGASGSPTLANTYTNTYRTSTNINAYLDVSGTNMVLIANATTNETFNWHIKGVLVLSTNGASSGGGSASLTVTNGLMVWLKADAGTSTTTDGVTLDTWADQSGNGRDATSLPAPSTAKPVYKANVFNGQPAILFDGTDDYMGLPAMNPASSGVTVFLVGTAASGGTQIFYEFSDNTDSHDYGFVVVRISDNTVGMGNKGDVGFNSFGTTGALTTTAKAFLGFSDKSLSTVESSARLNGSASGSSLANADNTNTFGSNDYGFLGARNGTTYFLNGYIAEIAVYNRILDAGEITSVESYLNTKYNLGF